MLVDVECNPAPSSFEDGVLLKWSSRLHHEVEMITLKNGVLELPMDGALRVESGSVQGIWWFLWYSMFL